MHTAHKISTAFALLVLTSLAHIASAQQILYVGNNTTGTVEKYSLSGTDLGALTPGGLKGIGGLAVNTTGDVYVADGSTNRILEYNPNGILINTITQNVRVPEGVTIDSSGHLLVSNYSEGTIEEYSSSGIDMGTFVSGITNPYGTDVSATGNLYVAEPNGPNKVQEFNSSGTLIDTLTSTLSGPSDVKVGPNGDVFVSSFGSNYHIERFSSTGIDLGNFASTANNPLGLAFDAQGDLFSAAYFGNTIQEFSPSGMLLNSFTDNNHPDFIAFSPAPVPESSTLVSTGLLLCLGLGGLAVSVRRRKARSAE